MPEFDRQSGERRIWNLIQFLREEGWAVTFVSQQNGGRRYARLLQQLGVMTYAGSNPWNEDWISAGSFDLAILAFWRTAEEYLPLLRRFSPDTRIIVDSIDLHFLRNARRVFCEQKEASPLCLSREYGLDLVREINVYANADGVFAVSQKESELINDLIGQQGFAQTIPDCEEMPLSPVRFEDRRGILFIGNFHHKPNVQAVEYLCADILPQLPAGLLEEHPVYVVGNALNQQVRSFASGWPQVKIVGWVPSILPYLERARLSVLPLLYGAGTKRKLIQSLMLGTPTVSTSIGVEGIGANSGEQLLVADDPTSFAHGIQRLLTEKELWEKLVRNGRSHVIGTHGRDTVRRVFRKSVEVMLARAVKRGIPEIGADNLQGTESPYRQNLRHVREVVCARTVFGSTVLVVSKGDPAFLEFEGRRGWHFPRSEDGEYAGYYPADSRAAISHLEDLRLQGADVLVFPESALWWLDHYADFAEYLRQHAHEVSTSRDHCRVFRFQQVEKQRNAQSQSRTLSQSDPLAAEPELAPGSAVLSSRRPQIAPAVLNKSGHDFTGNPRVLVLGIYLARRFNNVDDTVRILSDTSHCDVTQRWVALGGEPVTDRVSQVTVDMVLERSPKFQILNRLLERADLTEYHYVLVTDDDVVLPTGFLDHFIRLQAELDFAIAQPARTSSSYIDHPIVERQRGVLARQTRFVEIGPVLSFHRSAFDWVFPFDLTSPMGWGYENVWADLAGKKGTRMGIVDAVPVDHSLRPPLAHYERADVERERSEYFQKHEHLPYADCCRVLQTFDFNLDPTSVRVEMPTGPAIPEAERLSTTHQSGSTPQLSVIIPTHNRADLLCDALDSLVHQSLPKKDYEVIVVDDGSRDSTAAVCLRFSSKMNVTYVRIDNSGIAAAKNMGIFTALGRILFFFDDDDIADTNLLREHLNAHKQHPTEQVAVLGYTTWAPSLLKTAVMEYVTEVGHCLFSYNLLKDGQDLDFTFFWGGRSSCKRSFLVRNGVFNPIFEFGSEDIELGYRLSKVGLRTIYHRAAVQYMNRAVTFDEFCHRSERQGRSQFHFAKLHSESVIQSYCEVDGAFARWQKARPKLEQNIAKVHDIEESLGSRSGRKTRDHSRCQELDQLYRVVFSAFKTKGIVEEADRRHDAGAIPRDSIRSRHSRAARMSSARS